MKEIYSKKDVLNELEHYSNILKMDAKNMISEEVAYVLNNVVSSLDEIIKVFSK